MRTITTKQAAFIKSLIASRSLTPGVESAVETARQATMAGTFSAVAASVLIDTLLALPKVAEVADRTEVPELGAYRLTDGRIVRIVNNQDKTRRYGKMYDEQSGRWEYVRGLGSLVKGLTPLTLAEAEEFGVRTGQCAICARTLTRAESIARGIGPVCAGKF